jgi:hypothetical protein
MQLPLSFEKFFQFCAYKQSVLSTKQFLGNFTTIEHKTMPFFFFFLSLMIDLLKETKIKRYNGEEK